MERAICKSIEILESLRVSYLDEYPFIGLKPNIRKVTYNDSTHYGLTKCITDFINMSDGIAVSINSTKNYRLFIDYLDRKSRIELGDILAIYKGKMMIIEVKKSNNYAKHIRAEIQFEIKVQKGLYFNAKTFQAFYEWFCEKFK
ncbi:hypothetical protein [Spirosoma radiotolerans]|uniref:Uncharacterized protein n=1 Tax=Spirosoma radiotolerans TaxID=1379870 RepID=A0A0E3ZYE9_9BACT|nr:hypothetical protein [Spirosoma radiotolerans]AKD56968.1 hypothetical protein SD10_20740 [Spirosoma radiotolerans]